jgi:hypothetical protein
MIIFEEAWILSWHNFDCVMSGEIKVHHDCTGAGTSNLAISILIRSFGVPDERGARFKTPYVPLLRNEGLIAHVEWTVLHVD